MGRHPKIRTKKKVDYVIMAVDKNFRRFLKTEASRNGMSILQYTKILAEQSRQDKEWLEGIKKKDKRRDSWF